MSKNILNQKEIRESYFFRCERCGKEVFGDFRDEDLPELCDSCKMILEAEKNIRPEK